MYKIPRAVYIQSIIDEARRFKKRGGQVWDVTKPRDNWERNLAHMEYKRIGWHNLWNYTTFIEVQYAD